MSALRKKLRRDLRRSWLQSGAVAVILGCGVAIFVMANGMLASLDTARNAYYDSTRMADLATSIVRAPDALGPILSNIPGVAAIEMRAVGIGLLALSNTDEPITAQILSLPRGRRPKVNDLVLLRGRWPDPSRSDEALVNEAFSEFHRLNPGSRMKMLIKGEQRVLTVVGVVSSPEFVFAIAPGNILPEPRRFGVLWINHDSLTHWLGLGGAFNDIVLRLDRDADQATVVAAIDARLARFGGQGLHGRDRMLAARYLADELSQLETLATILPPIFLSVAVFLINAILTRLVSAERSNIGLLKAFGYRNAAIGWHYVEFALVFSLIGVALGDALGTYFGHYMAGVYRSVYHLPSLQFHAEIEVYANALLIGVAAATIGAANAARRATRLAPANALAPMAPMHHRARHRIIEDRLRKLVVRHRILARRLVQSPRRTAASIAGIALSLALLIMSEHFPIAVDRIMATNFGLAQRRDVTLTFAERKTEAILREIARLPGVMLVEPMTVADVVFTNGHRSQRETVIGYPSPSRLDRLVDINTNVVPPDDSGITLSRSLATKLGVRVGDRVRITATEGRRTQATATVVAVVQPFLGAGAYANRAFLLALLGESEFANGAHLRIDATSRGALNARIPQLPAIVGATYSDNFENSLRTLFREGVGFFSSMFLFFSLAMAAGVAYSAARITIDEQRRDLATLRVLGYGRGTTSRILIGEIGLMMLAAIPLGLGAGAALSNWMMKQFETELFTFPFIFDAPTYVRASIFVCSAVMAATLWVRREIDRIDLVAALKAHE